MTNRHPSERKINIKSEYDVVVVGGGIYGATMAWEAVSRGLTVLLMEKHDFGSGTSANSLKTIHGGLRSLQRLDFKSMREYIRERRALMRIASHLVEPMKCVTPTYSKLTKSKMVMWTGINLYDLIAYDRNKELDSSRKIESSRLISKQSLLENVPALDSSSMTGAACWFDAQVYNSERLVLSFIMSASRAGADVFNYMEKKEYLQEDGKITGLVAVDELTGKTVNVKTTTVIDCTGPWASQEEFFRNSLQDAKPKVMARAVNLVIKRKLSECALGVSPKISSRLLFIAPWREGSIVGTWYYPETNSPEQLGLTEDELMVCLEQINSVFPSFKLVKEDVSLIHRGLQPADTGKPETGEPVLWTESLVFNSKLEKVPTGMYWVQGVKLTTARNTAIEVINSLTNAQRLKVKPSLTHMTQLYGGEISNYEAFSADCLQKLSARCSSRVVKRLIKNYGSNLESIIKIIESEPVMAQLIPGSIDTIRAELNYALENEMTYKLSDLLLRRTDIGTFAIPEQETINYCADIMAEYFGWSETDRQQNIENLLHFYPAWCIPQHLG